MHVLEIYCYKVGRESMIVVPYNATQGARISNTCNESGHEACTPLKLTRECGKKNPNRFSPDFVC